MVAGAREEAKGRGADMMMALGGSHGISREPLPGCCVCACESIAGVDERAQGCGRLCTMTWGPPTRVCMRVASIVLSS